MPFNLHAKRSKRPLDRLRSLSDDCADLRPSDLDGLPEKELHHVYFNIKGQKAAYNLRDQKVASLNKEAVHGTGQTFYPVGNDFNPYKTSPLVNNPGPEFGGRWRRDMPGSGDQHINDDSDKPKSGRGNAMNDDFNEGIQRERINDLLQEIKGPQFVVRLRLSEEEEPNEKRAKEFFGDVGQTDGKSVFVVVDGYQAALEMQKKNPKATIEPKGQ